jgi:hypothetical protein
MKKVSQSEDDILLDYLDGNLSTSDREKITQALAQTPALRARLEELKVVTSVLSDTAMEFPSKNFTHTVMNLLDQYPAQRGFSVRNGIFLLVGVLLAVGMAIALVSSGTFDNSTTSIDLNQFDISKKFITTPLPAFEFSSKLIVNIIIILNLGLAWILLDRTILKPFFQKRMQSGH